MLRASAKETIGDDGTRKLPQEKKVRIDANSSNLPSWKSYVAAREVNRVFNELATIRCMVSDFILTWLCRLLRRFYCSGIATKSSSGEMELWKQLTVCSLPPALFLGTYALTWFERFSCSYDKSICKTALKNLHFTKFSDTKKLSHFLHALQLRWWTTMNCKCFFWCIITLIKILIVSLF